MAGLALFDAPPPQILAFQSFVLYLCTFMSAWRPRTLAVMMSCLVFCQPATSYRHQDRETSIKENPSLRLTCRQVCVAFSQLVTNTGGASLL